MKFIFFLCGIFSLVACSQLQPFLGGGDESRQVTELIAYAQRAAQLGAEEQRRELALAVKDFAHEHSLYTRLHLAVLLAQPGNAVSDDARTVSLLEPVVAQAGSGGALRQFAAMLHTQVSERLKEQRRAQQLREQLDALRVLERNLMERGQSGARKK